MHQSPMWSYGIQSRSLTAILIATVAGVASARHPVPELPKLEVNAPTLFQEPAPPTPSLLGVFFEGDLGSHAYPPYWVVGTATRHRHDHAKLQSAKVELKNIWKFLSSARSLEISCVISSMLLFTWMYGYFFNWQLQKARHGLLLLAWLCMGLMFFATVHMCYGAQESAAWITGYMLELIFSIENVFIFHIIADSCKAPARFTQKALFCVILGQVIFQAVFFMGLAHWLHRSIVLPYMLGIWLIYVGWEAARGHNTFDMRDTVAYKFFHYLMGARLVPEFREEGYMFFTALTGTWGCTMLLPLTISLFLVDVLLEVDVTLTKIETLNNNFICFSSSVVAACAVPELYFVARTAFERFHMLRFGVSFALVFYGLQMLLHSRFELPAFAGILIVVGVMMLCTLIPPGLKHVPSKPEIKDDGCLEVDI